MLQVEFIDKRTRQDAVSVSVELRDDMVDIGSPGGHVHVWFEADGSLKVVTL